MATDEYGICEGKELQDAQNKSACSTGIQCRYVVALMTFLAFFNCMSIRTCFNISLVAMVNFTASEGHVVESDECPGTLNSTVSRQQNGEFNWDSGTQSLMLGAFFYGYMLTQFPGGYLAERFGGKMVLGLTVLLPGLLVLLIPTLARWHPQAVVACRVLMGFFQGPLYPSNNALWGKWAPLCERSRMLAISTAGALLGYVASEGLSGLMCDSGFLGGWPIPFYVFGSSCVLWFLVWMYLGHSSPATHPRISQEERRYIEGGVREEPYRNPPWLKMFSSKAFWAIAIYLLTDGIGFYFFSSAVPIYMRQILKFDISQNGIVSALPYMSGLLAQLFAGPMADYIKKKRWLSPTATCKLFTIFGEGGVAVFLIAIAFVDCNQIVVVVLLTIGYGLNGFTVNGAIVNSVEMAPKYAGTIMGLCNPLGNIGGFVSPDIVSALTNGKPDKHQWQKVFFVAAGVYGAGTLAYLLLASSEEQEWAKSEDPANGKTESDEREKLLN